MIKEAMVFLSALKEEAMEPKILEIDGKTYCNKIMNRYDKPPMANRYLKSLKQKAARGEMKL